MRLTVILITFTVSLFFLAGDSPASDFSAKSKIERSIQQFASLSLQEATLSTQSNRLRFDPLSYSISVIIEPAIDSGSAQLANHLRQQGLDVEATSSRFVRAKLPINKLEEIAQSSEVGFVRTPLTAWKLQQGSFNRGVLQTGGNLLHANNIRGEGVTIAVIDAGFEGLTQALHDEIFSRHSISETFDYTEEGLEQETDHGLQVARIAHEMAPSASLILMRVADEVDLENAVRDAIRLGAQVINHSLGWFDSNFGDGKGVIDDIARLAEQAGVLWVNAAGNHAQSHWMGTNRATGNNHWIEFEPGLETLEIWMSFPGNIDLVLVWDDWPLSYQDYDFYLTNWKEEVIASSEERQMGRAAPRESISHFVEQPGTYKIKIKAHRATKPMRLKIYSMEQEITPAVPEGSIMAPADCTCTLAVGAISSRQWNEGIAEFFSAQGPTGDGRIKPDIMGPDGTRGFYGTSASAPHVAGAAALLLSRNPAWGLDNLRVALLDQAVDIYEPGKDIFSGFGKMELVLSSPQVTRSLSTMEVPAGSSVDVSLELRVPASHFGAFEVSERVPAKFDIELLDHYGAEIINIRGTQYKEIRWRVGPLGPGDTIKLNYKVQIPNDERPAQFSINGTANGVRIEGGDVFRIIASSRVSAFDLGQPLLRPHVSSRSISFLLSREAIQAIDSVRIQVFNLDGRLISDSGFVLPQRVTVLLSRDWARGVYLTRLSIRGKEENEFRHQLQKFYLVN
jgi:subtilisin family serine protease